MVREKSGNLRKKKEEKSGSSDRLSERKKFDHSSSST